MTTRKKRTRFGRALRRVGWVFALALMTTPFVWLRLLPWGMGWKGWALMFAIALGSAVVFDYDRYLRIKPKPRSELKYDD